MQPISITNYEDVKQIICSLKPSSIEEIKPNICISTEQDYDSFNKDVKIQMERIEANPIGKRLLEKIRSCASLIFIFYGIDDTCLSIPKDKNLKVYPVVITYSMQDRKCSSSKGEEIPLPKHVNLFHELVHAYHALSGRYATSQLCDPLVWTSDEEYKTIMGFPSKNKDKTTAKITENAFRKAENLPERFGHQAVSINGNQKLDSLRLKLLGSIHEQNQLNSSISDNPPPIALCSVDDLGPTNYCVVMVEIKSKIPELSKDESTYTLYIHDHNKSFESKMENACYYRPFSNNEAAIEPTFKILKDFCPKLTITELKVLNVVALRLSEQEVDTLQE